MTCIFCEKRTAPPNQLIAKGGRDMHIGCLVTAYDKQVEITEAQRVKLEDSRLDSIRLAIALNMASEEIENWHGGDKLSIMICDTALKLHRVALEGTETEKENQT